MYFIKFLGNLCYIASFTTVFIGAYEAITTKQFYLLITSFLALVVIIKIYNKGVKEE